MTEPTIPDVPNHSGGIDGEPLDPGTGRRPVPPEPRGPGAPDAPAPDAPAPDAEPTDAPAPDAEPTDDVPTA